MHDIKTMRRIEDMPVRQVPKNRPPFPYFLQGLRRLPLLSRLRALFPTIEQLINFFSGPHTWLASGLIFIVEQTFLTTSPLISLVVKPPSMPHEHGFGGPLIR